MSDPVSALHHATDTGGIAQIAEIGPLGMITLRGSLGKRSVSKAIVAEAGVNMPAPRNINLEGDHGAAWMSPDELLILCPYTEVHDRIAALEEKLAGQHALVVNVSDARAVFRVTGPKVRDVIGKLAPVDLRPDAFNGTMFRRTRFAQVPAAFWMPDAETAQIVCFRSVAQYMFDLLKTAAQPGSEVGHF